MDPSLPIYLKCQSATVNLEFLCHPDQASFDKEAGYPGAMFEAAHRYFAHGFTLAEFHKKFIPKIEELSGIARRIDEKKFDRKKSQSPNPDKLSPVYESYTSYLTWLWPQLTNEQRLVYSELALSESREFRINVAPAETKSPIDICYYKRADSILEQEVDVIKSKLPKYIQLVPNYEIAFEDSGKPNRDSLARLLQKFEDARFALED